MRITSVRNAVLQVHALKTLLNMLTLVYISFSESLQNRQTENLLGKQGDETNMKGHTKKPKQ